MYSFLICFVLLAIGYFSYGKFVSKIFTPKAGYQTPAYTKFDGVDYVPMPTWKVLIIQFLNIAGTGPIFGAIMGAMFGPACFVWIVLGSIFAGAVHDYLSAMLSISHDGATLPSIIGHYMGPYSKKICLAFTLILLLLVGSVFVYSPALILNHILPIPNPIGNSAMTWVIIIFAYYVLAMLFPIDKIIGRIYPAFAILILFMAVALGVCLVIKWPSIPEIWDGLQNRSESVGLQGQNIFPCLFITLACGAISGFHGTQSPLMARCIKNEADGRKVFYGSMIMEGMVALVWAAIGSYFFFDGGMQEVGASSSDAPRVVVYVSKAWLGYTGGILAIIGVIIAPISSGDTAFRSSRLIIAEALKLRQSKITDRLKVSIPIFIASAILLWYNIADPNGFGKIWQFFGWSNQILACLTLWMLSVYLYRNRRKVYYYVSLVPAAFMTAVVTSYFFANVLPLHLSVYTTNTMGISLGFISIIIFYGVLDRNRRQGRELERFEE